MTYIVGMVSQKGGVGKSTLARLMAREFGVFGSCRDAFENSWNCRGNEGVFGS